MQFLTAVGSYLLLLVTSFYILWVFFLAVMSLKRAKDAGTLSRHALVLGTPVLIVGLLVDLLCNVLLSVIFLEFPQEWTVTARLKRHKYSGRGWQQAFASALGDHLLDDFDPSGLHL
jgi:uncharacterized membrane protein